VFVGCCLFCLGCFDSVVCNWFFCGFIVEFCCFLFGCLWLHCLVIVLFAGCFALIVVFCCFLFGCLTFVSFLIVWCGCSLTYCWFCVWILFVLVGLVAWYLFVTRLVCVFVMSDCGLF